MHSLAFVPRRMLCGRRSPRVPYAIWPRASSTNRLAVSVNSADKHRDGLDDFPQIRQGPVSFDPLLTAEEVAVGNLLGTIVLGAGDMLLAQTQVVQRHPPGVTKGDSVRNQRRTTKLSNSFQGIPRLAIHKRVDRWAPSAVPPPLKPHTAPSECFPQGSCRQRHRLPPHSQMGCCHK